MSEWIEIPASTASGLRILAPIALSVTVKHGRDHERAMADDFIYITFHESEME